MVASSPRKCPSIGLLALLLCIRSGHGFGIRSSHHHHHHHQPLLSLNSQSLAASQRLQPLQHWQTRLFSKSQEESSSNTEEDVSSAANGALLNNATSTSEAILGKPKILVEPANSTTFLRAGPTQIIRASLDVADRPSIESGLRYSSEDWFRSFSTLYRSYVLRRIKNHLLFTTSISAIVTTIYHFNKKACIPLLGHTLIGGFLSLLLAFRTNTGYSRFWEARGMWSLCMKICRGLAIDVVAHIRPHSPEHSDKLLQLLALYPDALTYTCLAGSHPLACNVKKAVEERAGQANVPPATVVCLMMQEALREAEHESTTIESSHLESLHHSAIAHDLNGLTRIFSACEKIVTTPVPWSYSRHLSRLLTVWTGTLPLAIVSTLGWLTIPTTAILCWALYGIEEIGHLIEQPFVGNQNTDRDLETKPYDIGLPVFTLANQVRYEIEQIRCIQDVAPSSH